MSTPRPSDANCIKEATILAVIELPEADARAGAKIGPARDGRGRLGV
jgi:hypothetical protein